MNKKPLKLFVWEGVLCDYTCGMMVALATDVEHARRILIKKGGGKACLESIRRDVTENDPTYVTRAAKGFYVYGGG